MVNTIVLIVVTTFIGVFIKEIVSKYFFKKYNEVTMKRRKIVTYIKNHRRRYKRNPTTLEIRNNVEAMNYPKTLDVFQFLITMETLNKIHRIDGDKSKSDWYKYATWNVKK